MILSNYLTHFTKPKKEHLLVEEASLSSRKSYQGFLKAKLESKCKKRNKDD
jgi:hypothetical protein